MQQGAGLAFPAAAATASGDGAAGYAGIGFVDFLGFVAALVTFIAFAAVVPFGTVSVAATAACWGGLGVCGGIAVGVRAPPVRLETFDAFDCQVVAGQLFDGFKHFLLGFVHQGNGDTVRARPACASDAVDVVFGLGRQFVVDDEGQLGDVQTACGDVGGDEDAESMGDKFFKEDDKEGSIKFGESFEKAWEPYADASISGSVWLREGYASEPLRTGKIIVSVASSASVLYYEDIVTYDNNVSEPIEVIARTVPIFEGGEKLVMQRGAGICTLRSNPKREAAAATFLKWLTEPNTNVNFVTKAGYMPVTKEAFDLLPEKVKELENPKYRSLYEALAETQKTYSFYTAPQLPRYLDLEMRFEKNVRLELTRQKQDFDKAIVETGEQENLSKEQFIKQSYENIKKIMQ